VRKGECLLAIARANAEFVGLICLSDPENTAGPSEEMALEHASTVLAVELGRMFGEYEAEQRAGRDLVDELLANAVDDRSIRRARALGIDLSAPRRVVVVEASRPEDDDTLVLDAVRRVARSEAAGVLMVARRNTIILLAEGEHEWSDFRNQVAAQLRLRCRLGVGSTCRQAADYWRSHQEAVLALRVLDPGATGDRASIFDELGVYQLLAQVEDVSAVEHFCRAWIGKLVDYDDAKSGALVETLTQYLQQGANQQATARRLSIHRNTLKYRLQRVRDVSGLDLTDPEVAFNLQLATRIWHVFGALRDGMGDIAR
jgi:sugar diacid utilization regulator